MTLIEITSRDTLDPTIVKHEFTELLGELNLAAAQGKQFVLLTEADNEDDDGHPVILETKNITRARLKERSDAYIGR